MSGKRLAFDSSSGDVRVFFIEMKAQIVARFQSVFGRAPEILARAPGRIEVIGNHTDYNGGAVLGASIDRGVWVALARRNDGRRRFFSELSGGISELAVGASQKQTGKDSWLNYPLGVIAALPVFGLKTPDGFDFLAESDLPMGAGLSSSAALELSSGLVFLEATGQRVECETLVKIGRHAENNFVGVPCGILDQGVSGFGKKDHLVSIDCRGPKFATVPLPADSHFWIFNTHHKHALVDGFYQARHRECMEAARALGVALLVDASVEQLTAGREKLSPEAFKRAKHVIEENARVHQADTALRAGDLNALGRLLTASHRSSQTLFENSTPELDLLVDTLVETPHVFGARLTGGGFGGAVMALTDGAFGASQADAVADAYAKRYNARPEILHCRTGDGAALA
jgi:galactokinase